VKQTALADDVTGDPMVMMVTISASGGYDELSFEAPTDSLHSW